HKLSQLYDLEIGENYCFISMELIEGKDFLTFVREAQSGGAANFNSIRTALSHLINGLTALHVAAKLHQDIKPTNVLVEETGRAVLVDFGLSMDLRPGDFEFKSQSLRHAGTPAYMAPERLRCESPTEASDWYSVGAMLYEGLVGVVPFRIEDRDNYYIALSEAQKIPPLAPHLLNSKVPKDLSELTLALLQYDPSARPTGSDMAKLASLAVATFAATQQPLLL